MVTCTHLPSGCRGCCSRTGALGASARPPRPAGARPGHSRPGLRGGPVTGREAARDALEHRLGRCVCAAGKRALQGRLKGRRRQWQRGSARLSKPPGAVQHAPQLQHSPCLLREDPSGQHRLLHRSVHAPCEFPIVLQDTPPFESGKV